MYIHIYIFGYWNIAIYADILITGLPGERCPLDLGIYARSAAPLTPALESSQTPGRVVWPPRSAKRPLRCAA